MFGQRVSHRRSIIPFAATIAAAVMLFLPGSAVLAGDGTFVVAINFVPTVININYDFGGVAYNFVDDVYDRLVRFDVWNDVIPGLATSWSISADGRTYRFNLAQGVKWHDGKTLTSADVVWTVESLIKEKGNAADIFSNLQSVTAPDRQTVVFQLKESDSTFLGELARRYGWVVLPKHIWEGSDPRRNPANTRPIGTGPFKFEEFVPGSHVSFVANDQYYRGRPRLDRLVFRVFSNPSAAVAALQSNEIQLMSGAPSFADAIRMRDMKDVAVEFVPSVIPVWLGFNLARKPLSDVRVREAIAHAINRSEIASRVYLNALKPADGAFLSTITWAFAKDVRQPEFNRQRAEELLDAAGLRRGPDGTRFRIKYTAFRAQVWGGAEIGQVMREQLRGVGIDLEVEVFDFAIFAEKIQKNRDFDLTWSGGPHGPDPYSFRLYVGSDGYRNVMGYNNKEVDALFNEARRTSDRTKQREAYHKIQAILVKDLPRLNLIEWSYPYPYRSAYSGFWWEPLAKGQISADYYGLIQRSK